MERYYSGDLSKPFWEKINAMKDSKKLYTWGVKLQNLESKVLLMIEKEKQG